MIKKYFGLIAFFMSVPTCLSSYAQELKLISAPADSLTVTSAYFDISLRKYKFPREVQGKGGAILAEKSNLIFASAEGDFFKINLKNMVYLENYLPKIYLGQDSVKKSKKYTYQELPPRVHDLYFYNGYYYVSYDKYNSAQDSIVFCLARMKKGSRWEVLYESPPLDVSYYAKGSGGKITAFDNKVFFTVGDYSLDRINKLPSDVAPQNKKLPFGKVNYIDLNNKSFHIYSMGHRNPLGLLILRNGKMLSSENGPQGGDEINEIIEGKNYGWPYASFGTVYGDFSEYRDKLKNPLFQNYEPPIFAFVPSVAPTSMIQVFGFNKKWDGDILLGSLKAMTLFHLKLIDNRVVFSEPIPIGFRIRDLKQVDNKIIILDDEGALIEIKVLAKDRK